MGTYYHFATYRPTKASTSFAPYPHCLLLIFSELNRYYLSLTNHYHFLDLLSLKSFSNLQLHPKATKNHSPLAIMGLEDFVEEVVDAVDGQEYVQSQVHFSFSHTPWKFSLPSGKADLDFQVQNLVRSLPESPKGSQNM